MSSVEEIIAKVREEDRTILTEFESKQVLAAIDLPITNQILVPEEDGKDSILEACNQIGYPVVMKLMAQNIIHKSDAGAVKLNLKDDSEAEEAFNQLISIEAEGKKAISVQEMAKKPIAEIIIGSLQDPQFGPTIMFGIGGVLVEVMKDVSFRIAPISDYDADEMIHEIKGFKILDGYRGNPKADLDAVKDLLKKIADLAFTHQEISEMDLNPVFTYPDGIKCVDARIILKNNN
jgi:acyl-CoA synthetase (NDP forming)